MHFPNSVFNQSPVLFLRPRVARTEWCRPVIYNCVLAPRTRDYPRLRNQLLWRSLLDRATSRTSSLSRCGRSAGLLVCPPCCWPLTGHRAASHCRRLQVTPQGYRAHESVVVGVRYARVDPHVNPLSARPAADAARSQYLRNNIHKQKRTMNKGTSTLLSTSNVMRTAVRPRAARPPFTVQSSVSPPTT